jgi:hypothetical protein
LLPEKTKKKSYNMDKKYFYRLGAYKHSATDYIGKLVIPKHYNASGWDVRSWQYQDVLKEITKEMYDIIVEDEKYIKEAKSKLKLQITTHHCPIELTIVEMEKFRDAGIQFMMLEN